MLRTNMKRYNAPMSTILVNPEYYGVFKELLNETGMMRINPANINKMNIMPDYIEGLLNVFRDSIEQEFIHNVRVLVQWDNGKCCKFNLFDLYFNLVMWKMLVDLDATIQPYNIFIDKNITGDTIKNWIDTNVIDVFLDKVDPLTLNRTIYHSYKHLQGVDEFALYLANTFNYFDFVGLDKLDMEAHKILDNEYSAEHTYKNVAIEDAQDVGMEETKKLINIITERSKDILGYDHCCAAALRSQAGISERQFKEFAVNIGPKPDGLGGIYPHLINTSFLDKGLDSLESMFVESASAGRYAQIIAKTNVANSGAFARILGLNNIDTDLHADPNYVCNTKNFVKMTINTPKIFKKFIGRWFKWSEDDPEDHCIGRKDFTLIAGKTIYLRDPMTCQSKTMGDGICFRCYGKLAYINRYVNIGKLAAEILSAILTQRFLSAKHILSAKPIKVVFGDDFAKYFQNEEYLLSISDELESTKKIYIKINLDDIDQSQDTNEEADDDDDSSFMSESLTEFIVEDNGIEYNMHSNNYDSLTFTSEFVEIIHKHKTTTNDEGAEIVVVPFSELVGIPLFAVPLANSELSKSLTEVKHIINFRNKTSSFDKDTILQAFMEALDNGGLGVHSSHASVILSNMIRRKEEVLETPDWSIPNQDDYQIMTVSSALKYNPSTTVTLMYQGLRRTLINPITYKKRKPSKIDSYFMDAPQNIGKDSAFTKQTNKSELNMEDMFRHVEEEKKPQPKVIQFNEMFRPKE